VSWVGKRPVLCLSDGRRSPRPTFGLRTSRSSVRSAPFPRQGDGEMKAGALDRARDRDLIAIIPGGTSLAWLNLPKNDETKNHSILAEALRWILPCLVPAASS
jgi:hypothetical protein